MKTSEILIAAKALIDEPGKWTQGTYARNSDMEEVDSYSEDAVCFCSIGAIYRITPHIVSREGIGYLRSAMGPSVVVFNDTHPHAEVMQMWDRAIELAKAEEEA